MSSPGAPEDHAKVTRGRGGLSAAWIFPLVAVGAAAWMFINDLESRGPEIEISFTDAPGIEAGKTPLVYRGVVAGTVTDVRLDDKLRQAVVTVRLEKFAAGLAVETTDFWVDRPMLTLQGVSGLTSLIQGNSIRARMGTGAWRDKFQGTENSPVLGVDDTAIPLHLECDQTQPLDRGAPVTFRGVRVGRVREQSLTPQGRPYINLDIDADSRSLLKTSSRFWLVPATSVTLGPGGITLDFSGLDTLIQGGIAFDDFGAAGAELSAGATLPLHANEELARASGTPFIINFPQARGIHPGQTRLTYLGVPVGMVTAIQTMDGKVEATAQFDMKHDFLRRAGSIFTLIEPMISLQGISGLETLITGVFIDCTPGAGSGLKTSFAGVVPQPKEDKMLAQSANGPRFLLASSGTSLAVGAPVLYRKMQIGSVLEKKLVRGGGMVELTIGIQDKFANLVRENSVFWEDRGIQGSIGFVSIRIQTATPLPFTGGGAVSMATPDTALPVASANTRFTLHSKPNRDWEKWNPQIPAGAR